MTTGGAAAVGVARSAAFGLAFGLATFGLGGCIEDNPSLRDDAGDPSRWESELGWEGDSTAPKDGRVDGMSDSMPDAMSRDAIVDVMPSDAMVDAMPSDAILPLDAAPDATTPPDATPLPDHGPPTDCPANRGRTSGLAESFGEGAFCDALYVCLPAPPGPDFVAAFTAAFPEALCRAGDDCYDLGERVCTCNRPQGGFCRAFIRDVDATEYHDACTLAAVDGAEIVCGGDF